VLEHAGGKFLLGVCISKLSIWGGGLVPVCSAPAENVVSV
jgi:hypothetical protein